ncbi:organic cation/carnitine transporter 2-like [Biomphalaria glabrata]|uniref:Organic cation/carnitine transporter 2-like n=1 Tax=Biomphalaria glabrata TaxID=6526 RepID=A0A9U8EBN5_BIOGL|nr:organic cation/carnitine transporter 2-like [Biomphalaria glabrata]XP_013080260.2 organic cation/carnitine transporter 2-like [Biomphalaria glabrata]XP_013080261.2 organic cation/carnitine transporter 2-like [Biomphalaria glabrata]XP_055898297.1 organic cation/carnitine transporter 2-like [Biomphalaria glabrata]KAI8789878.1 solute carrier family 22 member 5 [Biomphalaria glabrata]
MQVDTLQLKLTQTFKFQIVTFFCLGAIYGRGAWNVFAVLFLAGTTGHSCSTSGVLWFGNLTQEGSEHITLGNLTASYSLGDVTPTLISGECDVTIATENGTNVTRDCPHGWVYYSEFESTIISEWELVCVRAYLSELSTTVYLLGSMFGALLISPLSDKYGRRVVLLVSLIVQAVVGSCVSLSPNYTVFTALRFVVGFFNMSIGLSSYVMVTELFPEVYCTLACCGLQIFWAVGIMLTSLFGFIVRNWRHLQLLISLPNILFIVMIWFLPESLPWLISQGKLDRAQAVVNRIAKFNGIKNLDVDEILNVQHYSHNRQTAEEQRLVQHSDKQNQLEKENEEIDGQKFQSSHNEENIAAQNYTATSQTLDPCSYSDQSDKPSGGKCKSLFILCSNPRLRFYSLILFYLFFVSSLSYFGISLSTPVLHGDQFINLFLLGVVEIPAYILCVVVGGRFGRKIPLCVFLLICGLMNIIAAFTSNQRISAIKILSDVCVIISKFAITGVYTTIYLYAAEMFPTSVRNQAMGLSSFFENLGSLTAPFIIFSAKSIPELPMILFGAVSIVGAILVMIMPETHRRPLPVFIEDLESLDKRNTKEHLEL